MQLVAKTQKRNRMLKPNNQKKSYANRPLTPLGDAFGLTSTPVSEVPSRTSSPPPPLNPYMYQPARTWTHPTVLPRSSSNYAQAVSAAETVIEITEAGPLADEKSKLPHPQNHSPPPGSEGRTKKDLKGTAEEQEIRETK